MSEFIIGIYLKSCPVLWNVPKTHLAPNSSGQESVQIIEDFVTGPSLGNLQENSWPFVCIWIYLRSYKIPATFVLAIDPAQGRGDSMYRTVRQQTQLWLPVTMLERKPLTILCVVSEALNVWDQGRGHSMYRMVRQQAQLWLPVTMPERKVLTVLCIILKSWTFGAKKVYKLCSYMLVYMYSVIPYLIIKQLNQLVFEELSQLLGHSMTHISLMSTVAAGHCLSSYMAPWTTFFFCVNKSFPFYVMFPVLRSMLDKGKNGIWL